MKEKQWYYILGAYVWQYKYTVCMFAIYINIFAFIFYLYDLDTEAVWYAAGLCVLLTVVVLTIQFLFYIKRHRQRQRILKNIRILDEQLPEPKTLAENDYQQMIFALKQIYDVVLTEWQNERQENMNYYTTWVHQIKTPISVMRMILQAEDTKENRELATELFRIEQYVEMVLCYLRLGSESSDFVIQEYKLDTVIRQAIHKYASLFIRKRIQLEYEPTEIIVLTDEKWLLFIIEQMLSNAIKYTQEGAVTITVTQDKRLKIADTGIGIAPEDVPRIFEKGFTGYNGRADKKSTGLGLYLCKMAADRLSHKISVTSEIGKGTVFSIDLHSETIELLS